MSNGLIASQLLLFPKAALDGLVSDEIQRKSENLVFILIICACAMKCFKSFLPMRVRTAAKEPVQFETVAASSMTAAIVQPVIGKVTDRLFLLRDEI